MNNRQAPNNKIVLATKNQGKIQEFKTLFSGLGIEILSLKEFENVPEIIEDGTSFEENAKKKAETICQFTRLPTIADDSGLVVDALAGAPGINSARYAGENATDEQNNQKLLHALAGIPKEKRKARFVAYLAFAVPNKETIGVEDIVEGYILESPRGQRGFGYDPLFYLPELGKTMAELDPEIKNQISHRGKAMRRLFHLLKGEWEQ
ncbi:XTP/dITP diphosphatase [Tepidibacillus fermentans]|uniref:dITP/XTP pyrophosphatase n=1 Tax=Tepidibacillus fermentans TaxID=1281767 RepID=A0A4R3KIP5_9BACI|nr:XTP/dITP diphosphatase [Tepidibacillus fermentans]TCS83487.1 XTP/dITP diphosphohydrolase [Tepidibacillus fermentans]